MQKDMESERKFARGIRIERTFVLIGVMILDIQKYRQKSCYMVELENLCFFLMKMELLGL